MLSDRTDLRNSSVSCTLKSYLFASLRCINDISLMNFPAVPLGGLLYVAMSRSASRRSLLFRWSARPLHCFNLFYPSSQHPLVNSRFVWDCKGRKLFQTCKLFFIFFRSFLFFSKTSAVPCSPYFKSPSPSSHSPFVVTSVAGCKGRKLFRFPKLFLKFFPASP